MSALFTPIKLGNVEFPNRIVVVADVPVQRRRRHRHRLASRPSRHAGQFRRGPGHRRGDACRAPRPHHPRLHGALLRRQRGGAGARHRPLPAHRHRQARHPDRARRPQGLLAAAVGGRRRAAGRIRTRGRRSRPSAIPFGAELARAARGDAGRHRAGARGVRQFRQARGADRLRRHRAALRARLSGAFVPVAGVQPSHRPVRRLAGEPHAVRPARSRRRCGRRCRRASRSAPASPAATGATTGSPSTTRWPIPRRSRPTASTTSTCRPAASPPTRAIRPRPATTCRSPSGSSARPASPPAWSG